MRNLRKYLILLVAVALVGTVFAQERTNPYAARPDDPFSISASVSPQGDGSFTVHVRVIDKKTSSVVLAPTVNTRPNVPAEIFYDRVENRPEFEVRISVDAIGKANVTFRAFEHVLQRSSIQAASGSARTSD